MLGLLIQPQHSINGRSAINLYLLLAGSTRTDTQRPSKNSSVSFDPFRKITRSLFSPAFWRASEVQGEHPAVWRLGVRVGVALISSPFLFVLLVLLLGVASTNTQRAPARPPVQERKPQLRERSESERVSTWAQPNTCGRAGVSYESNRGGTETEPTFRTDRKGERSRMPPAPQASAVGWPAFPWR